MADTSSYQLLIIDSQLDMVHVPVENWMAKFWPTWKRSIEEYAKNRLWSIMSYSLSKMRETRYR